MENDLAALQEAMIKSLDFNTFRKFLFVQPHPDDNEIGAGGTIAKLAANQSDIFYLTVTDGRIGTMDPIISPGELIKIRHEEAERAGRVLGVRGFYWLDLQDGSLSESKDLTERIVRVIRTVQPEVVVTVDPWLPYEAHLDHVYTGRAVAFAALMSAFPHAFPAHLQIGHRPWAPQAVAFYATHQANTIVDISTTLATKLKAVSEHRSQFYGEELSFIQMYLTQQANQAASGKDFIYGEAFKVLSPRMLHMNVDAYRM